MKNLLAQPLFTNLFWCTRRKKSPLYTKAKISQAELSANDMWMLTDGHCFRDQTLAVCKNRKKATDDQRNIKFESGAAWKRYVVWSIKKMALRFYHF